MKPYIIIIAAVLLLVCMITPVSASPNKAHLVFAFDDGKPGVLQYAAPILNSSGFEGITYIITTAVEDPPVSYMSWNNITELQNIWGWEIGSHTRTHPELNKLTQAQLDSELGGSYADLVAQGIDIQSFASPYGVVNNTVIANIAKYYSSERGWMGLASANFAPFNNYWMHVEEIKNTTSVASVKTMIDTAVSEKRLVILMFHNINTDALGEYDVKNTTLQEIVDYAAAYVASGDLIVTTPGRLLDEDYLVVENLIDNPSFEVHDGAWVTTWYRLGTDGVNQLNLLNTSNMGCYPNNVSSIYQYGTATEQATLGHPHIPVTYGSTYYIKVFINLAAPVSGELNIAVSEYDASSNWLRQQKITTPTVSEEYCGYVTGIYTPSEDASSINIDLFTLAGYDLNVYYDNVLIGIVNDTTPYASFTISDDYGSAPHSVQFTDTSYSTYNITNWSWDFGDGSSLIYLQNPDHTFTDPGIYTVTLTITNNASSTNSSTGIVTVIGETAGWLSGYTCRDKIDLSGHTTLLTDYPMKFYVHNTNGNSYGNHIYVGGKLKHGDTFDDLRVTDRTGTEELPTWIEDISGSVATIWVNIDSIPLSDAAIYIYYGNEAPLTNKYTGREVFTFFDDFTRSTINTTLWSVDAGAPTISDGILNFTTCDITSKYDFSKNYAFTALASLNTNKYSRVILYLWAVDTNGAGFTTQNNFAGHYEAGSWNETPGSELTDIGALTGFQKLETIRYASNTTFNINNAHLATHTGGLTDYDLIIRLYGGWDADAFSYLDYCFIRKVSEQEPVWSYNSTTCIQPDPVTIIPTVTPNHSYWEELDGNFVLCSDITTGSASDVEDNSVTLNGIYNGTVGTGSWFRWGSSHGLALVTPVYNSTEIPNVIQHSMSGIPLYPGKTYYYRACSYCGCGNEESFTLAGHSTTPVPIDTEHYSAFVDAADDDFNVTTMLDTGVSLYTENFGMMFWGVILFFFFVGVYMRQELPIIPLIIAVLGMTVLAPILPPDWYQFVLAAAVLILAGIVAYIIFGRRQQ